MMSQPFLLKLAVVVWGVLLSGEAAQAQYLNEIGVTLLRAMTTNVNGSGIRLVQTEAEVSTNPPAFEVNPADVGQAAALFTYYASAGSSPAYPNSLGTNSWHAEAVANYFYGMPSGVATNAAHVGNYDATYFYNNVVATLGGVNAAIVNQSFVFDVTTSGQQQIDTAYDNYAAQYGTLFVSGAGNGGTVSPPATCYNGIGVGVYDGTSSGGPTADNGRCKPDLTGPGVVTSYSTPMVAGTAALLMQAAVRGDGGSNTNAAANARTIKALLLNGAVKPANWTNAAFAPLDLRYGAGMVNAFNAYEQLAGGMHGYTVSQPVSSGAAHPPTGATGTVSVLSGWDYDTITSSGTTDGVNHYYFHVTNNLDQAALDARLTLVWNRPRNSSAINNLNLFLYNAASGNLVMASTSLVDNVEHIFVPRLAPGRYDAQVWKAGGSTVSASEAYALAWAFTAPRLHVSQAGTHAQILWPAYPAGYAVAGAGNLTSSWSTNGMPSATFANGTNVLLLPLTNGVEFFRLVAPDF